MRGWAKDFLMDSAAWYALEHIHLCWAVFFPPSECGLEVMRPVSVNGRQPFHNELPSRKSKIKTDFEWGGDKKLQLPSFTYSQFFPKKKISFPNSGGSNRYGKCVESIMFSTWKFKIGKKHWRN
jgi:hypothetical protein